MRMGEGGEKSFGEGWGIVTRATESIVKRRHSSGVALSVPTPNSSGEFPKAGVNVFLSRRD